MVLADTNGATRMTTMGSGGQARCMGKALSDGRLVNVMMENGLKGKKMGWACSRGVMAPPMMVSGSLARNMASGCALLPVPAIVHACNSCICNAGLH